MDQNDQSKIWTNPQSAPNQGNLNQNPVQNNSQIAPPSGQLTVEPQFHWEESLPRKEMPLSTEVQETFHKVADFTSHEVSGAIPEPEKPPEAQVPIAGRILPHDFLVVPKPVPRSQFHFQELPEKDQVLVADEKKSKKGLIVLMTVAILLAVSFGGGFYLWKQFQVPTVREVKIILPQRSELIGRVISGLGADSPSLVKIEEDFQLEQFDDPAKVFTIQKPRGWKEEQKDPKIIFSQKTPDKDALGFQYIPRIEIVGQKTASFSADLEKVRTELKTNSKNQIISEVDRPEKDFLAYNIEAMVYDKDSAIHISKLAVAFGGNFYVISASSLADKWDHYRNMFNIVLTSFSPAKEL